MLRELFQLIPDALVVVDREGRIITANSKAELMFGYPPDALQGLAVEMLVPEPLRDRHRQHRADYVRAPRVRPMGVGHMKLTGRRQDGSEFPVEIALAPLHSDKGEAYLASIRDFSETQSARLALRRAGYDRLIARIGSQALAADDLGPFMAALPGQLAAALHADSVAVALLNEDGGVEVPAATGREFLVEDAHADAARIAAMKEARPESLDGRGSRGEDLPLVRESGGSGLAIPLTHHDGVSGVLVVWSREPAGFDHDARHLLQSVAIMLVELMQRRKAEEQLAHLQRLDALGQMTGGVAHDFNNLLTVLSGNLQLLELHCSGKPDCLELIDSAGRALEHGAELTRKLLAFARRQRLEPEIIDPAAVLDDVRLLLQRTLDESIHLKVSSSGTPHAVFADRAQLEATLLNLALNARDAMPHGGDLAMSIEAGALAAGEDDDLPSGVYVEFVVADTGHGMTPESLARAVEPFYTTKPAGRGTGLGLSMAYGFASQSGGRLHIDSRLGYGTRVTLLLPARSAPERVPPAEPRKAVPSASVPVRVLVVEDDPDVRRIAVGLFESLGYRAQAAGSFNEAVEHLERDDRIGLLFSDIRLGAGEDGIGLARHIRRRQPAFPVVLATAYVAETDLATDAIPGPPIRIMHKPYTRQALAEAVQASLVPPPAD